MAGKGKTPPREFVSVRPPKSREGREALKLKLFDAIDKDGDGFLIEGEMLELAKLVGFEGDRAEWRKEYVKLCQEVKAKPPKGVPRAVVLQMLDDKSDSGCFVEDEDLKMLIKQKENLAAQVRVAGQGDAKIQFEGAPLDATEDALRKFFSRAGQVSAVRVFRNKDGHSRGMGYVTYGATKQAKAALRDLDGAKLRSKIISVKASSELEKRLGAQKEKESAPVAAPPASGWYGESQHQKKAYEGSDRRGYDAWQGEGDAQWSEWYGGSSASWKGASAAHGGGADGRTVYFLGAPFEMPRERLCAMFEECGKILHFWLFKLPDGRSRGQGLVEYSSKKEARYAIEYLNGYRVSNRTLKVQEDRVGAMNAEASDGHHYAGHGSYNQGGNWWDGHSVFFSGAPSQMPVGRVQAYFEEYGVVDTFRMFRHPSGKPKGIGVMSFVDPRAATEVLLHGIEMEGWQLYLREAEAPTGETAAAETHGWYQDQWAPSLDDIDPAKSVYFANVPFETREATLKSRFASAGKIQSFHLFKRQDGSSRGMGIVEFTSAGAARWALQTLAESDIDGRQVLLSPYKPSYSGY